MIALLRHTEEIPFELFPGNAIIEADCLTEKEGHTFIRSVCTRVTGTVFVRTYLKDYRQSFNQATILKDMNRKIVFWVTPQFDHEDFKYEMFFSNVVALYKSLGFYVQVIYPILASTTTNFDKIKEDLEKEGVNVVPEDKGDTDERQAQIARRLNGKIPQYIRDDLFSKYPKLMGLLEEKFLVKPVIESSKGILHVMRLGVQKADRHIWDEIRQAYVIVKFQENYKDFGLDHPGWTYPNYCDIYFTLGRDLNEHLNRPFDVYPLAQNSFNLDPLEPSPIRDIDFIWIARFSPEKQHGKLLDILNEISINYRGVLTATTYGNPMDVENPQYEELKRKIGENSRLEIVLDHPDIRHYIRRSRMSLFTSEYEGCSKGIAECLSHNVPILYNKHADVTNMSVQLLPQFGRHFDIDDPQDFKEKFLWMRSNFWRFNTSHLLSWDVGPGLANFRFQEYLKDYFSRHGIPLIGDIKRFSSAWEVPMGWYLNITSDLLEKEHRNDQS